MTMNSIQGVISSSDLDMVNSTTPVRFKNMSKFDTPEALILYEQGILGSEELVEYISKDTGKVYATPKLSYIPREILDFFVNYNVVPIRYDNIADTIYVGVLHENVKDYIPSFKNKQIEKIEVPIHWYVENYTKLYSEPDFLYPLPIKDIFDFIVSEAIALGAADITISSRATGAKIYYNVRKRNVPSKRSISKESVNELAHYIATEAGQTLVDYVSSPRYLGVDLDSHHRGRVTIVSTYHGKSITIRVLPNSLFTTSLEDLNLTKRTINFIREYCQSKEYGLRILVGPTFSGKNTTIAASLYEILQGEEMKAISVEQPVELLFDCMEQMSSETPEEFRENVISLGRQNPDLIYIAEMTDYTAEPTLEVANTGKVVWSAIHANSIANVPFRLQDLTGLSIDRIMQNLHSIIFQELKRDEKEDCIYPITRCVYFSKELRKEVSGKSIVEIMKILEKEEDEWVS